MVQIFIYDLTKKFVICCPLLIVSHIDTFWSFSFLIRLDQSEFRKFNQHFFFGNARNKV